MAPSTTSVNDKEVVALIKKGTSIPKAAAALKIQPSVMAGHFYRLEPVADPSLKIEGSPAKVADAIVKGRNSGLRWERLAARSGKTVSEVKAIFETKSGTKASESYAGKGRHFGATPEKKAPASKPDKKPAAAAKPGAAKPKARTRADRQAKTGN